MAGRGLKLHTLPKTLGGGCSVQAVINYFFSQCLFKNM